MHHRVDIGQLERLNGIFDAQANIIFHGTNIKNIVAAAQQMAFWR